MEIKNWTNGWLDYKKRKNTESGKYFARIGICGFDTQSPVTTHAWEELKHGAEGYFGVTPMAAHGKKDATLYICCNKELPKESFRIRTREEQILLDAGDENGLLYGVFHLLRLAGTGDLGKESEILKCPENPLRMLNHWDNMDGSIERGYSGASFFFKNNEIIVDERTRDYVRLAASVGINGVVINNVNVKDEACYLLTPKHYGKLIRLARIFEGYGIRLFLSLNYASTIEIGGLDSADPFDPRVIAWWEKKMEEVFTTIPNFGGFLVKADSEGRPGPFTYGRTQADGANMLADIAKKYGALIIWRCFVYNCTQDWRDKKTDRARAGYDNFIGMDGDYHDNVILQIKNGPIDFQVREPVSPLLGGLKKTNQILEVQIAQEYTGQQIDVCYLIPMYKEVLDFRTYCGNDKDKVSDIISGRTFGNQNVGIAAVANTGNDKNWTGNTLAQANLYGFGRLAFEMGLSAEEIAREWIIQTITEEESEIQKILSILMPSREIYEKYTSPLGVGFMVNPGCHYGPSVDGYEYSRWGTYHRADHLGIGVDRTKKGTGYTAQYQGPNVDLYENPETCPENLLLFFHHLPYTWKMKGGETLIQHIYDTHFEGVEDVKGLIQIWESLKESLEEEIYENVRERMDRQLQNAKEWCDQINSYFYRKSGISDAKNREIY